jgi:hypothetical protein
MLHGIVLSGCVVSLAYVVLGVGRGLREQDGREGREGGKGGDIPAHGGVLFKLKSNIEFFISENVSFSYWFCLLRSYI